MTRDRQWDPNNFPEPLPDTAIWTDYDGVSPTGDYTLDYSTDANGVVVNSSHIALGMAEIDFGTNARTYHHANQIGSTRLASSADGAVDWTVTYTSFGEPVSSTGVVGVATGSPTSRYQYAGAWGYENLDDLDWGTPASSVFGVTPEEFRFPYLHTGARYYDPGTGRFLQRDPIGIAGGLNVYEYVGGTPTIRIDPEGESGAFPDWILRPIVGIIGAGNVLGGTGGTGQTALDRVGHRLDGTPGFIISGGAAVGGIRVPKRVLRPKWWKLGKKPCTTSIWTKVPAWSLKTGQTIGRVFIPITIIGGALDSYDIYDAVAQEF